MNILKQSTAATIKLGPMVDDTDGKTAETALTISQADIRLSKNGGDFAQTNNNAGATHDENGYYDIPLDTTDTGTLGRLRIAVSESGALPVWQDFLIVTANVYDSLVGGSDKLDVNAAELGGTAQTGNDVGADVNEILTDTGTTLDTLIKDVPTVAEFEARTKPTADYFDPAADAVANVTAVGTTTNLTNLPTMPADWVTASGLKADAVAEIQNGLALEATLSAIKGAGWTTESLKVIRDALTAAQADLDNPDQYKADVSGIPASVWGYATRTLSSFGTLVADIWTHVTRTLTAFGFTVATNSDANVTAIKNKTDNLPASPAPASEYDTELAAIQADLDNPAQYKADVSGLALEATLTAIKGVGWTDETLVALMTAIEAIVPGSGATAQEVWEYVTRTLTDPDSYKADVSGLALESTLTTIKGAGWTTETLAAIDALIDAIKAQTDLIPASPAAVGSAVTLANDAITASKISADAITEIQSGLAKSADLQDVEDKVDVIALDTTTEIPASITALSGKVDTIDNFLDTEIAAILEDTGTTLPATLAAIEGKVDTADAVVDAIKAKTDLMDASAITYITAVVGTTIMILRGDTFTASITDIGSLTDYMSLDFTVKSDKLQTDDEATIRIRKNASGVGDGLLRLNGAAPTTETGSITIDDEATGDITVTLDETATKELSTGSYSYDVQLITATVVKTLTAGKLTVISDVTRAVA
jgi:hypothetical protein